MKDVLRAGVLLPVLLLRGLPLHVAAPLPERDFLERHGEAPPNARHEAFDQIRRWHAAHDAVAAGYTWIPIGPAPVHNTRFDVTGRVTAIAISPVDPDLIVIGTSGGGIWRSTDAGTTFRPVSDDQADINVGAIAIAPSNPNVLYAGMGDARLGTGVLKSTDAGATWHRVSGTDFPARSSTTRIAVDPVDENIVWLAQYRALDSALAVKVRLSLLKSTDGGVTWKSSFDGLIGDFVIASEDGLTLVAGATRTTRPGTGGLYRTTDGGATWTRVHAQGDPETPPATSSRGRETRSSPLRSMPSTRRIARNCWSATTEAQRGAKRVICRAMSAP